MLKNSLKRSGICVFNIKKRYKKARRFALNEKQQRMSCRSHEFHLQGTSATQWLKTKLKIITKTFRKLKELYYESILQRKIYALYVLFYNICIILYVLFYNAKFQFAFAVIII